ncbi:class I SAM-dependent methyltransferase [Gorillibacterium massiliense]|uniref:class I SAM-dependent methyltransferase n=1 Tax=Gorillibacterium massiliense TaxID=1280390 RepID=UPI0004B4A0E5|nr:class I SAM-dependent methyltransferase [Gorillibacterium massiliense]
MPINFHDARNRMTYTTRTADESWRSFMRETVDVRNKRIADIGCGGGIYTKALIEMGAAHVIGVDFSSEMLKGAASTCKDMQDVSFLQGNAYETKLPANMTDIVLERGLIHHLDDLDACFKEACRILKPGGDFIIQDRTPEDCLLPGSKHNIRGHFPEKFPRLIDFEIARRHHSDQVSQTLERNGLRLSKAFTLWETRCIYTDFDELENELLNRSGRSILHELTDTELRELIEYIKEKLDSGQEPIIEKDAWTVWAAVKA